MPRTNQGIQPVGEPSATLDEIRGLLNSQPVATMGAMPQFDGLSKEGFQKHQLRFERFMKLNRIPNNLWLEALAWV